VPVPPGAVPVTELEMIPLEEPSPEPLSRAAHGSAPGSVPASAPSGATSLAITTTGPDPQQLEMELAAARDELKALHEMLEDLPEIFERKFQQRLATVMEHQKHLLADNHALRERLYSLNPAAAEAASSSEVRSQPMLVPTVAPKQGWGDALKRALRIGGPDDPNGKGAAPRRSVSTTTGRP